LEEIRNEILESEIIAENLLTEHAELVDILASSEDLRKRSELDFPLNNNQEIDGTHSTFSKLDAENLKKIDKLKGT